MAGHHHKYWICPFFIWDEKRKIHCESAVLAFSDKIEFDDYADKFCASHDYKHCTIAQARMKNYERNDKNGK